MSDTVIVKEVKALITATDASSPGITQFEARLDAMKDHAKGAGQHAGEGFLEGLSEKFGRGSFTTHILHALEGAGPLLAVGLGAKLFGELGEGVRKAAEGYGESSGNQEKFVEGLVKSIPIIGSVVSGLGGLIDALDGTALAEGRAKAAHEERLKALHAGSAAADKTESLKGIIAGAETAGLSGGELTRKRAEQQFKEDKEAIEKSEEALRDLEFEYQKAYEAHKKLSHGGEDPELDKLFDRLEKARETVKNAPGDAQKRFAGSTAEADAQDQAKKKREADELADFTRRMNGLQSQLGTNLTEGLKKQNEEKEREAKKQHDVQVHQAETAEQLQHFKLDELRLTGQLSEKDEKRLATAEQFQRKRAELVKILNDENASDQQKKQAQSLLAALPGDLQSALAADSITAPAKTKAHATGQIAGRTTGVAGLAQASADHDRERDKNLKSIADNSKKANDLLNQLISQIGEMNTVAPM
jgi:hypothetical protein